MNTLLRFLSAVSLFIFSPVIQASENSKIRLFSHGSFVPGYDSIIEEIIAGKQDFTHLVFSDTEFPFKGFLGSGGTTAVIDIGNGKALRLARSSELPMNCDDEAFRVDRDRLKDYLHTASELATYGLPVPEVWSAESRRSANYIGELEYVVVEKLNPESTLRSFLRNRSRLPESGISSRLESLKETALKAWNITSVRNLHSDNIVWDIDKKGWILMDFSREITRWDPDTGVHAKHIFSGAGLPKPWMKKIDTAVTRKRLETIQATKKL